MGLVNTTGAAITLNYSVGGSATPDSDYTALSGTVDIPSGQQSATIDVIPLDDILEDPAETVEVTLTSSMISVDSTPATVTILDDDIPGLVFSEVSVCEGCPGKSYEVWLRTDPETSVNIDTVTPDAQCTIDVTTPLTFTTDDWDQPQTISVTAVDDGLGEDIHTCVVTHSASSTDADYSGDFDHSVRVGEEPHLPQPFTLTSPVYRAYIRSNPSAIPLAWDASDNAESYTLYVLQISDNTTRVGTSFEDTVGSESCVDGQCSYTVDLSGAGDALYSWTVMASNEFTDVEAANGNWMFTVEGDAIELLTNGGFETGPNIPDGWKLNNATKDKRKCNKTLEDGTVKVKSFVGDCAFMFKGSADESSKLKQTFTADTIPIGSGDMINLSGYAKATQASAKAVVKLKVVYEDAALPASKAKINLTQTNGYEAFETLTITPNATVSKVKLVIKHTSEAGKLYLDALSLTVDSGAGSVPGIDGLQPLPQFRN